MREMLYFKELLRKLSIKEINFYRNEYLSFRFGEYPSFPNINKQTVHIKKLNIMNYENKSTYKR